MASELQVNTITEATSGSGITFAKDVIPATPLSHRNIIINGAMQVYQRGASSSTSQGYAADRFRNEFAGCSVTTSRETLSTSDEPYEKGFRYFIRNTNTSTSNDGGAYVYHVQEIEAQNVANSGWNYTSSSSYMTLQFWVRSSLAGTYYVDLETLHSTRKSYSFSFTVSANTWTKVEHTFSGNSGLTINSDNTTGFIVNVTAYLGPQYTTSSHTNNAWQNWVLGDILPDYSQNWANTSNATFDITAVQLERGSVATPFEHRSYAEELQRCQRYYQELGDSSGDFRLPTAYIYAGSGGSSYAMYSQFFLPVEMRASPSLTFLDVNGSAGTSGGVFNAYGTSHTSGTMPWSGSPSVGHMSNGKNVYFNMTLSSNAGGGAGDAVLLAVKQNAKVKIDAEL